MCIGMHWFCIGLLRVVSGLHSLSYTSVALVLHRFASI